VKAEHGSHHWNPLAPTGHVQRAREWSQIYDNDGGRPFVDLSQLLLELPRTGEEFVLYRGEYSNQPGSPIRSPPRSCFDAASTGELAKMVVCAAQMIAQV
jgi:hypothetical protein